MSALTLNSPAHQQEKHPAQDAVETKDPPSEDQGPTLCKRDRTSDRNSDTRKIHPKKNKFCCLM